MLAFTLFFCVSTRENTIANQDIAKLASNAGMIAYNDQLILSAFGCVLITGLNISFGFGIVSPL
jgi:hypothetical protein